MSAYLSIIRPLNAIMSAVAVYIGSVVAGANIVPTNVILWGMLVVFLVSGGGMAVNDIADAEIDKINRPKRPIPSGRISKKVAGAYSAVLLALGNLIAYYFLGTSAFYVSLLATLLLIGYALKLKQVMFVGNGTISLLVALTFIYGGIIAGSLEQITWLAVLAFLSNMGREIYKTIDDVLGDKQQHVVTVAVKYGVPKTKMIAGLFIIAAVALSFAPYFLGVFNSVYLFFVAIADIVFVATTISPSKLSSKLTKLAMLLALAAFLAGAYSLRI